MDRIRGTVRIIDCSFEGNSGSDPVIDLSGLEVPEGLNLLIEGERFTRPVCFGDSVAAGSSLAASLSGMQGIVRLGPCPACGLLCMYGNGRDLEPHAVDECIVAQIMGS